MGGSGFARDGDRPDGAYRIVRLRDDCWWSPGASSSGLTLVSVTTFEEWAGWGPWGVTPLPRRWTVFVATSRQVLVLAVVEGKTSDLVGSQRTVTFAW